MTHGLEHDPLHREFLSAGLPPAVVSAVEALVRDRGEVREAHLVATRQPRKARAVPTLVLVTDDPTVATTLARDLQRVLQPHARPGIVTLTERDSELVVVRGLGGELKRGENRFPWWLLFFGI